MINKRQIYLGDYVLATKYSDGDPRDHWAVGFITGILPYRTGDRYAVSDFSNTGFRPNGFRRVKKISAERGNWLLAHAKEIDMGSRSVWWWARKTMREK